MLQSLTDFGDLAVSVPLAALLFLWLLVSQSVRLAAWWLGVLVLCSGTTALLKMYFLVCPIGTDVHSPSGHTAMSTLVYGGLALILGAKAQGKWRAIVFGTGTGTILGIGLSRVLLNAHTASEVAIGFVVGGTTLALFGYRYFAEYKPQARLAWLVVTAAFVVLTLHGHELNAEEFLHSIGIYFLGNGMRCL